MRPDFSRADALDVNRAQRNVLGDVLARTARLFPERIAVVDAGDPLRNAEETSHTYREFDRDTEAFAHGLLSLGPAPDRDAPVALMMSNSYDFLVAYFGVIKAGYTVMPINYSLAPEDIHWILDDAQATTVIADNKLLPLVSGTVQTSPPFLHLIVRGESDLDTNSFAQQTSTFDKLKSGHTDAPVGTIIEDSDYAQILYTSGTTSRPKGALHSHSSLVISAYTAGPLFGAQWDRGPYATILPLPLFHVAALSVVALPSIAFGGTTIVSGAFEPTRFLELVERHKVDHIAALPMMWMALVKASQQMDVDLSSVTRGSFGMQPMSSEALNQVKQIVPNAEVLQTAGLTEVLPGVITQWEAQNPDKDTSWGMPAPGVEMAIMGDSGTILGNGETGEIVYRGPHVTRGYTDRPDANAQAFAHGWFHSGDVGYQDDDGTIWFTDRAKDIVKTGGENVSSQKVEAVLMDAPGVDEVTVIGTPHEHWGEAVTAIVSSGRVTDPDSAQAHSYAEELITFARERLAGFETPKLVRFVEALPRTSTGKIRKNELKELHGVKYHQPHQR